VGIRVYRKNQWFTALGTGCVHLSCTAQVNSAFYPPWDGKWVSAFGLSNNNKWWLCL